MSAALDPFSSSRTHCQAKAPAFGRPSASATSPCAAVRASPTRAVPVTAGAPVAGVLERLVTARPAKFATASPAASASLLSVPPVGAV